MTELDDIDLLAGEYVLGTLTLEERQSVALHRSSEPRLEVAIAAWERRLGPMIAAIHPVQPDAALFDRIRSGIRTGNGEGRADTVVAFTPREAALRRSSSRWRTAAIGMAAVAAALAGVIGWREAARPVMPSTYVALLQADKASPAFVMTVDTRAQMFSVRALAPPAEAGKTYELWLVNEKLEKPRSLGTVAGDQVDARQLAGVHHDLLMNATYAVSLEPAGGSPTGVPTGPVLFSGKLFQAAR